MGAGRPLEWVWAGGCICVSGCVGICFELHANIQPALFLPPGLIEDLPPPLVMYRHGVLDLNTVMFYTLIWVVIHAVLQQYIWEVGTHTHTAWTCTPENPHSDSSPSSSPLPPPPLLLLSAQFVS